MYGSETPIDIHCAKLVDWLVVRRHCKKDWGENLATVRRKIRAALKDMPENEEIKQLLIESKLDYFSSKRIVEILKTTEASSKNIFGSYSSQRMKDWQDIVYSYERNNIYIAELATDLIRQTNYEVPAIRKVIAKLNREKEETEKEKASVLKKAQQFQSEHQKLAQSYDITGTNVEQELLEKSRNLSNLTNDVANHAKSLLSEVEQFSDFVGTLHEQNPRDLLKMLRYVIEHGNTTVYEWKTGHAPDSILKIEKATSTGTGNSNPSEIDLADDEIDFGEDLPSSESSSGFVHVEKSDNGNGVTLEDTYIKLEDPVRQGESASGERIAQGDDAKSVLEFRKSRHIFLNNLHELEAFFIQLSCQSDAKDGTATLALDLSTAHIKLDTTEALSKIRKILEIMQTDKNRILFQMNDSSCFVANLKDNLAAKLKKAADYNIKADLLTDHIRDLQSQIREAELQLKKNTTLANLLQEKVGGSLSKLYSGRPINIMGCIGQVAC